LARIAGLAAVAVGLAAISSPQVGRTLDRYSVGEFAVRSIRAPYDISVVDDEATTRQRASAAAQAGVVVALDRDVAASLQRRSAAAFDALDGQLAKLEVSTANDALPPGLSARARREAEQRQQAARQAAADAALDNFEHEIGTRVPAEVSDALTDRATVAATGEAVRSLIETAYSEPVVTDLAALRRLRAGEAEPAERIAVVVIDSATRAQLRVVDDSVVRALETVRADVLTRARRSTPDLPEPVRRWAAGLVASWLRPNATPDGLASLERQRAASVAVLPVSVSFRRDQLIVGEGEPVTRQALLVLDAIRQRRLERGEWLRLAGRAGLLLSLFLVGLVVVERGRAQLAVDHRTVPYLLTSMVLAAVGFRVWMGLLGGAPGALFTVSDMALAFAFPSAATIMYARTVLPFHAASTYLAVQSLCLGIMWQFDLALVVNQLLGGAIAGHFAAACNGRQCVLRAGALAGAIVVPVAACLALAGGPSGTGVFAVLAASFLGCALSGPVALALGPLFEWMFGHVTRIRLVEMMNYEQPLLRRLTERAPGTFQHSVTMGLMMDAAARAIDADALLGRVGALFHDVGKTERPEYFVENQQGGNPHDLIDPVESARIVIAHVHDGVSLAREAGLSERVIDFVREHHGTGYVKYFLAKATAAGHPVDPAQFSYPGPRPRSRESGLLMIADQVEATARALDEPTEDNLREMVRATIERVQAEGQLDDCPLTLQDLSVAREEFVQVLLGAHHRRIKYPAAAPAGTMPPAGRGVRSSAAPKSAAAASGERRVEGFERRSG
jgi:putative nucleotidyltransferase with HDIG domain